MPEITVEDGRNVPSKVDDVDVASVTVVER